MITKEELRKLARKTRNSLDMEKLSEEIVENIFNLELYKEAQHIMLFCPLEHEVDLLPLLMDDKKFYLPKVQGKQLLVCPYELCDELVMSEFKTKEPITKPVDPDILDIIFVPALMADKKFNRIGYGGGFYDRFLSKNLDALKIIAIPSELLIDEIPEDFFDEKVNVIICEDNLYMVAKK